MSVITLVQEHQQGILVLGALLAALVVYRFFTRKSTEVEELEREYQEIVQAGKRVTQQRAFAADVDE